MALGLAYVGPGNGFSPSMPCACLPGKGSSFPMDCMVRVVARTYADFGVSCVQAVCWTAYGPGNGFCPFQLYRHNCARIPLSAVLLALVFHGLPARDQLPEEARRIGCRVPKNAYGSGCCFFLASGLCPSAPANGNVSRADICLLSSPPFPPLPACVCVCVCV